MSVLKKYRTIRLLNLNIHSISLKALLDNLNEGVVFTPNVDHLVKLQKDERFYKTYKCANWIVCDSKIVNLAAKFLKEPFEEVIPGSSLLPAFYEYHKENEDTKIFLLGAVEGVALKAMDIINKKVGRPIVVGAHSPSFGFENNKDECEKIIDIINESEANVLVVGVGAPKQENWIFDYKDKFSKIKIFMALGATLDFEAGNINRAPTIFQKLSMEWLYRLLKEPKRLWKRYLVDDMPFFLLVLKQKLNIYKNPMNSN